MQDIWRRQLVSIPFDIMAHDPCYKLLAILNNLLSKRLLCKLANNIDLHHAYMKPVEEAALYFFQNGRKKDRVVVGRILDVVLGDKCW